MSEILIRDANNLISGIMAKSQDPMEDGLERGNNRLYGFLLGLFTVGFPCGMFAFDASVDSKKLTKIQAKLLDLCNAPIASDAPNFLQAVAARNLQLDLYRNIAQYTETARNIKNVAAVGFGMIGFGSLLHALTLNPENPTGAIFALSGTVIGLSASAGKLGHTLVAGYNLERTKQELAHQFSKQMLPA